jgi:hypothetical protein
MTYQQFSVPVADGNVLARRRTAEALFRRIRDLLEARGPEEVSAKSSNLRQTERRDLECSGSDQGKMEIGKEF